MSNLNLFEKGTNHMTRRNTELRNGGSEFDASLMSLRPCVGDIVVDDGEFVTVNNGGALQEADWSERNIVSVALDSTFHRHLLTVRSFV